MRSVGFHLVVYFLVSLFLKECPSEQNDNCGQMSKRLALSPTCPGLKLCAVSPPVSVPQTCPF